MALTASTTAYSAKPPWAPAGMPTMRLPTRCSAPGPALSTTPMLSIPGTNGGWSGTVVQRPRTMSVSLKLTQNVDTFTRTSFGPGGRTSTVVRSSTFVGSPSAVATQASACSGVPHGGTFARAGRRYARWLETETTSPVMYEL